MRAYLLVLLLAVTLAGCESRDCLPENASDTTRPDLRLMIEYTDPVNGQRSTRIITAQDSSQTLKAATGSHIVIRYEGSDEQGLRRIHLGLTRQKTVGVGVQTEYVPVEPIVAECPVSTLRGERTIILNQDRSSLALGLVAVNWAGLNTSTPTHVVTVAPQE